MINSVKLQPAHNQMGICGAGQAALIKRTEAHLTFQYQMLVYLCWDVLCHCICSGDASSGRSAGTKELAPARRPVPPHHLPPPQVGHGGSSFHIHRFPLKLMGCSCHVTLFHDLSQVVRGSAHRSCIEPLTLATMLLVLLSPWQHR